MTRKETIVKVYDYLSKDPNILGLLGLTGATPQVIEGRISKTRQLGNMADRFPRLAIWEGRPKPFNRRVSRRILVVDVHIPLEIQRTTGLAFDLIEAIVSALDGKPFGTGLMYEDDSSDLPTAFGWYKASVRFGYNYIS